MNFDQLVDEVEQADRFRVTVRLLLDATAYNRASDLQIDLDAAMSRPADDDVTVESATSVAQELHDLYEQHPPTIFVFEALTGPEWSEFEAGHDNDRGRDAPFWRDLMGRSCVAPEGASREHFDRLHAKLSVGQWEQLRQGVEAANVGLFDLRPTRAATALLRGMRQNSTSATDGSESLDPTG
jgi:hypothetical protein